MRKTTVKKYSKNDFERFMNTKPANITDASTDAKYRVEKNIPIPEVWNSSKFPLLTMEIGDSFVVPLNESKVARSACSRVRKRTNGAYHFITRAVTGRGRAGKQLRIWRTPS